jgi:hypothetical protein
MSNLADSACINITQNAKEKKFIHNYVSSPISLQIALSCDVLTDFFSKLLCKLTNKKTTNNKKKGERQRMCKTRILPFICESHTIRP